jgi:CHAD domain-containing protein
MANNTNLATVEIFTTELKCLKQDDPENIAKDNTCLGGYAYEIIVQQSKRIFKLRSQVLEDTDIEPLHQMRVSTRKLRSAIALFEDVIEVKGKGKKSITPKLTKALKKLTKTLGNVRDLDVMQQWFEHLLSKHSKTTADSKNTTEENSKNSIEKNGRKGEKDSPVLYFSKAEIKTINTLIKALKKHRETSFSELKALLKSDTYKTLTSQLKHWIKQPDFSAIAQQNAHQGAARKIIAPIASLLEHPAWLVASHQQGNQAAPIENITLEQLNQELEQNGTLLHDLRKQTKQVRYQAEFFRGLYGTTYAAQIKEFRDIQEILGELQDQSVMSEFLSEELDASWAQQLPTIEATFQAARLDLWQQWQPYQKKYLKVRSKMPNVPQTA